MKTTRLSLVWSCLVWFTLCGPLHADSTPDAQAVAELHDRAALLLERDDLAACHGWLRFLAFEAEAAEVRFGPEDPQRAGKLDRWAEWIDQLEAEPGFLDDFRGMAEWAYMSPVDGSGQPFRMRVPDDYDPARPVPLVVYMHGLGGNHLEHSTNVAAGDGEFWIGPLGRARGGGYWALSEADILHAVDYVRRHWSIDPDRIHLHGGSMGGGGTFRLAVRYPHLWASARPQCGYGSLLPYGNLLTVPVYSTHSRDDWVVSVLDSRGPLTRALEAGASVIIDETDGLGHAIWTYAEGIARANAWFRRQVRPDSREVRRIDYTALDGGAVRAWWAQIDEWGAESRPARFSLHVGTDQTLYANLENIRVLKLRVDESPWRTEDHLSIVIGGATPLELSAPLPPELWLVRDKEKWTIQSEYDPPAARLRTPGGPTQLYDGSPLLIVYGTRGTAEVQEALRLAAEAAARSPNPVWAPPTGGGQGSEGVPHHHNLYGNLPVVPDTDVTEEMLARANLVLIGTAEQNQVVERIAATLPLDVDGGSIRCSDGVRFPVEGAAWSLVFTNPWAPQRLLHWVAGEEPESYRPGSVLLNQHARGGSGSDLMITDHRDNAFVAARSFDTQWRWQPRNPAGEDPLPLLTHAALAEKIGEAVRRETGADFGLTGRLAPAEAPVTKTGVTLREDLLALMHYTPLATFEVSGHELLELHATLQSAAQEHNELTLVPTPDASIVEAHRTYRVGLGTHLVFSLARIAKIAPDSYRHTDHDLRNAFSRWDR